MSILSGGDPFDSEAPVVTFSGGSPETDFDATGIFQMVLLKEFLPHVLPHAPRCPRPIAEMNLRLALTEFCERTRLWRYIVNLPYSAPDTIILAPTFATIHEIRDAWAGTVQLTPVKFSELTPADLDTSVQGIPEVISQTVENSIVISPHAETTVRCTLILKPQSGTRFGEFPADPVQDYYNQAPQFVFDNHAETIAHGALQRILSLPNQSFTNFELSNYFGNRFAAKLDSLFAAGTSGQQRARRRNRVRHF